MQHFQDNSRCIGEDFSGNVYRSTGESFHMKIYFFCANELAGRFGFEKLENEQKQVQKRR
jgi:hypothetical protein